MTSFCQDCQGAWASDAREATFDGSARRRSVVTRWLLRGGTQEPVEHFAEGLLRATLREAHQASERAERASRQSSL